MDNLKREARQPCNSLFAGRKDWLFPIDGDTTTMLLAQAKTTLQRAANKAVEEEWFVRLIPQREIRWVVCGAGTLILVAIAAYVVMKVRGISTGQVATSIDHLTEFQDLHERGAFNDQEMSRLKEAIKSNFQTELGNKQEEPPGFQINKPR